MAEGSGILSVLGAPGKGMLLVLRAHPGHCVSSTTVLQSMKLGVDVNRHKEVIVKAISAVLLLLLKHFKLNHVYQVPAFLCTGPAHGQCCPSSPEEQRLGPAHPLESCMGVLRQSSSPRASQQWAKEGEAPRGC